MSVGSAGNVERHRRGKPRTPRGIDVEQAGCAESSQAWSNDLLVLGFLRMVIDRQTGVSDNL